MTPAQGTLRVFGNPEALAQGVASWFCDLAAREGRFVVSLSGGSTPKLLYQALAAEPVRGRLPWERIVWTFGDERFVPPDDPASNYGMVKAAMFDRLSGPAGEIHPFRTTGLSAEDAAAAYEKLLRGLKREGPLFDLAFLGIGEDGHTASLIPGQPEVEERSRWVVAVPHGRENVRLTLTFPALDSSRRVAFLVAGEGKREVLDRLLSGDRTLPAGRVAPEGELFWFVDRAAAGRWAR